MEMGGLFPQDLVIRGHFLYGNGYTQLDKLITRLLIWVVDLVG